MPEFTLTEFAHRKWGDARKKRLEFAQVYCKAGSSHSRISAVIEAFCTAATGDQEHGNVAITYLLHCTADVEIAKIRYAAVMSTSQAQGNPLAFTTFAAWQESDVGDRHMLLLDTHRRNTTSIDTLVMLEITQRLGARAEKDGLQCLVVSISDDLDPVVGRDGVPQVQGYKLEGPEFPVIEHGEEPWTYGLFKFAVEKLEQRLEEVSGVDADQLHLLGQGRQYGPTLVLMMGYDYALKIYELLKHTWPQVELGCVMPWSSRTEIHGALEPSVLLKLIYVDDGLTVMPLLKDPAVLVGSLGSVLAFDPDMLCTVAVRDARMEIDPRLHAAFSLGSSPPEVHVLLSRGRDEFDLPSPALGSQFPHLRLFCVNNCEGRHPADLPIKFPDSRIMLFETARRLGAWGLLECGEEGAIQKVKHPLAAKARYRDSPNINTAVLLAGINEGTSGAAASVLVDMAVLVCHGPSSIFHMPTAEHKTDVMGQLGSLQGTLLGRLLTLAHRGQLWMSVACLDAFRRIQLPRKLFGLLRYEVIRETVVRANALKEKLNIAAGGAEEELTDADVQAVEEHLARAFLFNILLSSTSDAYFAVDFISGAKLSRHDGDGLDWEKLGRDSDTPGLVAGIYTYLQRSWAGGITAAADYQPQDVTVISLRAVVKALGEVPSIEGLRPMWKPVTAECVELEEVDRHFSGFGITDEEGKAGQGVGAKGLSGAAGEARGTQDSGVGMQPPRRKVARKCVALPPDEGMRSVDYERWQEQPRPLF